MFLGNMASADCAIAAAPLGLGSEVTSLLCKKATSTAPAECAQQLKQWSGRYVTASLFVTTQFSLDCCMVGKRGHLPRFFVVFYWFVVMRYHRNRDFPFDMVNAALYFCLVPYTMMTHRG